MGGPLGRVVGFLRRLVCAGDDECSASVSIQISQTGYSVEKERAERIGRLKEVCAFIIAHPEWQPERDARGAIVRTHCDDAFCHVCDVMGGPHYAPKTTWANSIIAAIRLDSGWRLASGERAQIHANLGGLACAAADSGMLGEWAGRFVGHGHIATISPGTMRSSGHWGKECPMVANVGERNGIMPASYAFRLEPEFYVYGTP